MNICVQCKKQIREIALTCNPICAVAYFDKKYPDRKHTHIPDKGWVWEFRDNVDRTYYSGFAVRKLL